MPKLLFAVAAALLVAASAAAQTGAAGTVEITGAWARATPGGAENGAAYLTIRSPQGDRLAGAATPLADKAELHAMTMDGGIMRMRELDAIDLPAGQPVTLKPGATHIMLVGLKQKLQTGQSVPLTLRFEKAGTREIAVAVGKVGAMAPESHAGDGAHRRPGH